MQGTQGGQILSPTYICKVVNENFLNYELLNIKNKNIFSSKKGLNISKYSELCKSLSSFFTVSTYYCILKNV